MNANDAIFNGLVSGMVEVGKMFEAQEYFVPELLMCADALYAGLDILKPHVQQMDLGVKGSVVIGTVEGDVHDIGKNIVKMMFDVAGFQVYDLGRDVPLDKFVEEQIRTDSDLVCLSAMMTTTMTGMKKVIDDLRKKNPNVKIMIGGAPVSQDVADKYGADGYAKDATNALKDAINMIDSLKKMKDEVEAKKGEMNARRSGTSCSSRGRRSSGSPSSTGYLGGEIAHLDRAVSIGVARRLNEDTLGMLARLQKRAVRHLKAQGLPHAGDAAGLGPEEGHVHLEALRAVQPQDGGDLGRDRLGRQERAADQPGARAAAVAGHGAHRRAARGRMRRSRRAAAGRARSAGTTAPPARSPARSGRAATPSSSWCASASAAGTRRPGARSRASPTAGSASPSAPTGANILAR